MNNNEIKYTYDENNKTVTASVLYKNKTISASAFCHPDDKEFYSEAVGTSIAAMRLAIVILRDMRDNEIIPQIKILKHLYTNISAGKDFNPKDRATRLIRRQYYSLRTDLKIINEMIEDQKNSIKSVIKTKEHFNNLERAKLNN